MTDATAAASPLRRRMIDDMSVRNLSPATQRWYLHAVSKFSRYFGRSPDRLGLEDVRALQVCLVSQGISWPALADIFRRHGHAYAQAHGGHTGRVERRVMSAIELCRTQRSAAISKLARTARTAGSPTTPVAIGIAQVSEHDARPVARCPTGRSAAGALFPCRVHGAGRSRLDRLTPMLASPPTSDVSSCSGSGARRRRLA